MSVKSVTKRVVMSKFGKNWGNFLNHALVTRPLWVDFATNQMAAKFSRQVFTNHVRSKHVFEHHVTSNPLSPFSFFSLCRRTCWVGDVVWAEKNYQCCRKYSLLDLEKLAKSTAMSKCKFGVSNTPFCRLRIIYITTANICFAFVHRSETPDEFCATKR